MFTVKIRANVMNQIRLDNEIETESEFAMMLGLSGPYYSQIKNGRRGINPAFIAAMSLDFGIPFEATENGLYEVRDEDGRLMTEK